MSFLKADQILVRLALTASCALLAACQGMYIHSPDRAAVATTAKKSIDAVDVSSISKTEQENLAKLLEAEIKAIDDRSRLIATLAVLDLAASDQSIAKQYESALKKMAIAMHAQSMLALKNRSDCLIDQKAAISDRRNLTGLLSAYGAKNIPACAAEMQGNLSHPPGLTPEQAQKFDTQYSSYVENCQTLLKACPGVEAITELDAAREKLADKQRQESELKKQIEKVRGEYQALVNANKDRAQAASSTEEEIRTKAKSLTELVNRLAAVSPTLANQIKGSAVVDLLNAAATGKSNSTDPDLAPALEIAKAIPSLAESIDTAQAKRAMVPVSHLLLALNNLTIQAERDERLRALDVEEIGVIERKVEALDAQAQLWRRYSDQLCNLVVLRATKRYPEGSCDTIDFPNGIPEPLVQAKDAAEPPAPPKLTCKVSFTPDSGTKQVKVVDDCVLGKSWRALFAESAGAAETRALNEAAAAYLNVRLVAYSGTIEEFRRIGLDHRRTVVRSEASLQQWKNLVSVPASELEGYYEGGLKPNELADLIVKALGFTAIAIGVSQ